MLALLTYDRAHDWHQSSLVSSVSGEDALCERENAKDDIREGLCEGDGRFEICYWEIIFAV